ncbi:hypothetical protein BcepSauron_129 [Burkholderia phage BcepSauron]|uniref:Glutamyl-tRNA amidotransferase n=2 Tax=Sarumanvirus TaxID=2843450 RepID=A0A482MLI3_9CAUD|nr:tRNA amidotransferase [Burkholderia phage BcepSaruman]YP_009904507.1 tRNA amidotransferase [Burkholderia phage BcepSauron]QBQ74509.1 hypothetical protein BcepSauron_129 [Burkholderia phage BcepSauron]QBX06543.1 aspartyl/glutamyl-tRNA amidotransferase subunit B-like protein [Burkholderia phage BcepSaruman]
MLIEQIKQDQVAARKAKNTVEATLLTTLLGEASTIAKNKQREQTTDAETVALVKKFMDRNKETSEAIGADLHGLTAERAAQLTTLAQERIVLERYAPAQMSQTEIVTAIKGALDSGVRADIGSLMGFLNTNHTGKFDGRQASALVRTALAAVPTKE